MLHLQCKGITKLENLDVGWVELGTPACWTRGGIGFCKACAGVLRSGCAVMICWLDVRHMVCVAREQRSKCRNVHVPTQQPQEYTGLKTLYLEQNAIADIENLDKLVNLRCLYLGKNMISVTVGLQMLTNLETLDLADNMIRTISGLSELPQLRTINISGNRLTTVDDIRDLAACPALQSLDVSSNKLEDPETVDFVIGLPLLYLRMMGNPAVSQYR